MYRKSLIEPRKFGRTRYGTTRLRSCSQNVLKIDVKRKKYFVYFLIIQQYTIFLRSKHHFHKWQPI